MIKAFNDNIQKTIGIVDDYENIRISLEEAFIDRGYKVKTYDSFASVKDWGECDFWVLDNDTGEKYKGTEYVHHIKNSVLYTASYSFLIDDLRNEGRMIDKYEPEELYEHIRKFFESSLKTEKKELVVGQLYSNMDILSLGYTQDYSDVKNVIFSSGDMLKKRYFFEKRKEGLIFMGGKE